MSNYQLLFTSLTGLNGGFACENSDEERASDKTNKRRTHDFVLCAMWHIGPYLRDFQDVRRGWMLFLELERTKISELGESGHVCDSRASAKLFSCGRIHPAAPASRATDHPISLPTPSRTGTFLPPSFCTAHCRILSYPCPCPVRRAQLRAARTTTDWQHCSICKRR